MIFIIDDDKTMVDCIGMSLASEYYIFSNAVEAMVEITVGRLPDLIFLDILLDGPDGFTFLHELVSYTDTAKIPVVIVSSLDFGDQDFSEYGVVEVLNKDTMMPDDIKRIEREYGESRH